MLYTIKDVSKKKKNPPLTLFLNILVLQLVLLFFTLLVTFNKHRIILWAPIYAHPGDICIYYIAALQTVCLTKTIENWSRERKAINLNSTTHTPPTPPLPPMDESLKKWILSLRQEDISGILWACQGCTERCVSKAIFVSSRPMVEAGPHDPDRSLYHNKCPRIPYLWSTAYRVGFPRSIGDQ